MIFLGVLWAYILVALILGWFIGGAFRLGGWADDLLTLGDDGDDW